MEHNLGAQNRTAYTGFRHCSLHLRSQQFDLRSMPAVVSLPEAAASRSVATSLQTALASDALPPTSAENYCAPASVVAVLQPLDLAAIGVEPDVLNL